MDLELRGKSVLIAGASKGIGLACAHGFAAEGAHVHLAARNTAALQAAAEDMGKRFKVEAAVHTVDIRARFVHQRNGGDNRLRRGNCSGTPAPQRARESFTRLQALDSDGSPDELTSTLSTLFAA